MPVEMGMWRIGDETPRRLTPPDGRGIAEFDGTAEGCGTKCFAKATTIVHCAAKSLPVLERLKSVHAPGLLWSAGHRCNGPHET